MKKIFFPRLRLLFGLATASFLMPAFAQEEPDLPIDPEQPASEAAPAPSVPAPVGPPNTARSLYDAIVNVENAAVIPDYRTPWHGGRETAGSGTGFLIGPNQFLTNAHVVSNSSRLLIKKYGDPEKYAARILHIAHDCDLALLECDDAAAFEGVEPLEMGDIPRLESTVTAIGYPLGGRRLTVTRGVVSRIDFQPYSHSGADLHLAIQIDAAINPGNSGGPVLQDGKVVGVAFQGISGGVAQNVGYMIPTPVIQRFLTDVEDGHYDRYVDLAIGDFDLINPAHRAALGLPPNSRVGTLVATVNKQGSCDGIIQKGDVILAINDKPVASNGYVEINGEHVDMNEIVERKFAGDTVAMTIWRDGKEMEVEIVLKPFDPYLIQANRYEEKPRFVTFAGLVFQPLDRNMMAAQAVNSLEARYLFGTYLLDNRYEERPEIVVLTLILPDAINSNFAGFREAVVDEVNGQPIKTLQDLYDALHPAELPDFFVVKFVGQGLPIVIEGARVEEAERRIQSTYEVGLDSYLGEKGEKGEKGAVIFN